MSAASSTVRAGGPTVSKVYARGNVPLTLTRPYEGRTPTRPSQLAGPRTDTPVSVPSPARQRPAATATPVPLEEPPGQRLVSQGFFASPKNLLRPATPAANSFMFILPSITVPAAFSLRTASASLCAIRLL